MFILRRALRVRVCFISLLYFPPYNLCSRANLRLMAKPQLLSINFFPSHLYTSFHLPPIKKNSPQPFVSSSQPVIIIIIIAKRKSVVWGQPFVRGHNQNYKLFTLFRVVNQQRKKKIHKTFLYGLKFSMHDKRK